MQNSKGGICLAEFIEVTSGKISTEVFYDDSLVKVPEGFIGVASLHVLKYPVDTKHSADQLAQYQASLNKHSVQHP